MLEISNIQRQEQEKQELKLKKKAVTDMGEETRNCDVLETTQGISRRTL